MSEIKQKKVVVYMPEHEYRQLRSKLILLGTSVSEWFRELVREFINK